MTFIGWPEAVAWVMWPNGEMQDRLAEEREYFPGVGASHHGAILMEETIKFAAGEGFYEEDRAKKIAVDPIMSYHSACEHLISELGSGARCAEGRPEPGALPVPIPANAWRGAEVTSGDYGHELRNGAAKSTLFFDVWLQMGASGNDTVRPPQQKGKPGAKTQTVRWEQFAAAFAVLVDRQELDFSSENKAHKSVADFLTERGHTDPLGIDTVRSLIRRFQAWNCDNPFPDDANFEGDQSA